jgi:hypothetical protein
MSNRVGMVLDRIEATRREPERIDIGPDGLALDLLQKIYRDTSLPLHTRQRAARDAIAYESAKLMAVAVSGEGGFAAMLDARLRRRRETKLIEHDPNEGQSINGKEGLPTRQHPAEELKPDLQSVPDRRFRRRV